MSGQSVALRKLGKLLTDAGLIELEEAPRISVERTYAGREQRSHGAWSFFVAIDGRATNIGSQYPLSDVVKNGFTTYHQTGSGDIHLDPLATPEGEQNA